MAKAKKTKGQDKPDKSKAEDLAVEFHKKMQASAVKHTKALKVSIESLEPRKGRDGAVPTNMLCVDLITGGGFPLHRMSTVSGDTGAGKTTLIQASMGPQLQKGIRVNYNDMEGAADHSWMLHNGCDMNKYIKNKTLDYIKKWHSGDDAFRYMHRMMEDADKAGASKLPFLAGLYYYDSIPAGSPEARVENDQHGSAPLLAQMLSEFIPMVRGALYRSNSSFVAVNQIRENPRQKMGNPEYEPGGNAPDFYADMKLWMKCVGKPKDLKLEEDHALVPTDTKYFKAGGINLELNPDGSIDKYRYTHVKTTKNRIHTPGLETYIRIWLADSTGKGQGFDQVWDTLRFYEEIGMCRFLSKDEVWLAPEPGAKMVRWNYFDLKAEILVHPDLREQGAKLMDNGKAFEMYFERIKNSGVKFVAPVDDEIDPDAKPPEDENLDPALEPKAVKSKPKSAEARG